MRRELFICCLFCLSLLTLSAQEIPMQEVAALEQVYGDVQESEGLLPMNELGIEFVFECINRRKRVGVIRIPENIQFRGNFIQCFGVKGVAIGCDI